MTLPEALAALDAHICNDNSCMFAPAKRGGMGTNGGCQCVRGRPFIAPALAGHAALRAGDREAWQEDGEVSGGEAEDMSRLVATTEIERYIDDRLGEIQKAPRMHGGTPHEVDAVCYILLEMSERFCAERPVVLRDEYTRLSRALHPKCPASLGLVGWLCDTHGETKAMGLVVAFYLLLLARLREVA